MVVTIKALTPELADDYFGFFENRAFTDNSPYRCYCQRFQMTKDQFEAEYGSVPPAELGIASRKTAERQIASGALRGYLAFVDGVSIGWCNANDRVNYPADSVNGPQYHAPAEKHEKAVVCFEIAPEFRGRGIATALLQQVIADAKAEDCAAVVSFPVERDKRYEWDFTGPVRLYEKAGFTKAAKQDDYVVMRKELK